MAPDLGEPGGMPDSSLPHAGAARLPVVAIVVAGHGCSTLKGLFAPLVAAFDALVGAMKDDVG
jgi:hypothetical protein